MKFFIWEFAGSNLVWAIELITEAFLPLLHLFRSDSNIAPLSRPIRIRYSSHIIQALYSLPTLSFGAVYLRTRDSLTEQAINKYSRTPFIRTLVFRIGLALRVNLSRILQS